MPVVHRARYVGDIPAIVPTVDRAEVDPACRDLATAGAILRYLGYEAIGGARS